MFKCNIKLLRFYLSLADLMSIMPVRLYHVIIIHFFASYDDKGRDLDELNGTRDHYAVS